MSLDSKREMLGTFNMCAALLEKKSHYCHANSTQAHLWFTATQSVVGVGCVCVCVSVRMCVYGGVKVHVTSQGALRLI